MDIVSYQPPDRPAGEAAGFRAPPVPPRKSVAFAAAAPSQGAAAINAPTEPVLPLDDVQGNTLVGFNKDHQGFLFLRIENANLAKGWLRTLLPRIASCRELIAHRREFRALRARQGTDPAGFVGTWLNVAFTFEGLTKLRPAGDIDNFGELEFRAGMAKRSAILGDPTDPASPGCEKNWVVGGSARPCDVLLIIASDDGARRDEELQRAAAVATQSGLVELFRQAGDSRADLPGHEHFGFRDGTSQPGSRGRVSDAPADFLTPRWLDPQSEQAAHFARPGQRLVWPGQFVLGLPRQKDDDPLQPADPAAVNPSWASGGSYLVVRRLQQDVAGFWAAMRQWAATLAQNDPAWAGLTHERLAALLVGRWPSGTPVARAPQADDIRLAHDDFANNDFGFREPSPAPALIPIPGYGGDHFPRAVEDLEGFRCPLASHLRKVNPRDGATDLGGENDTITRLILRRGIAYGAPLPDGTAPADDPLRGERGLMFLCYQSSIGAQFEVLQKRWANRTELPVEGGHDPVIGQNGQTGQNRARVFDLATGPNASARLTLLRDFVTPTGGEYFFAPSIPAIREFLAV